VEAGRGWRPRVEARAQAVQGWRLQGGGIGRHGGWRHCHPPIPSTDLLILFTDLFCSFKTRFILFSLSTVFSYTCLNQLYVMAGVDGQG
jgi:hypothetical protein